MEKTNEQVGCVSVDLAALRRNWQSINSITAHEVSVAAVVKADAYGLGASRVAFSLFDEGCREFYVATLAEGKALRYVLPEAACIAVLGGISAGAEAECVQANLIPVLSSLEAIQRWVRFAVADPVLPECILKFDSGMTRLGLSSGDLKMLLSEQELMSSLNPVVFMSHLACAEDVTNQQNAQQLESLMCAAELVKEVFPSVRTSLSNSSGVYLGPEYHFDQVRTGAALYGINPSKYVECPIESVVELELPVIQVKTLEQDASVGYGGECKLSAGSTVAIVQAGYADGLHCTLGKFLFGTLAGVVVPVVGRISMDTAVFDVSSVPANLLADRAALSIKVLDGDSINQRVACDSFLGYEVLTSMGSRYVRKYSEVLL